MCAFIPIPDCVLTGDRSIYMICWGITVLCIGFGTLIRMTDFLDAHSFP